MKKSNPKRKKKIKTVILSDKRILFNKVVFTLFCWISGALTLIPLIKSLLSGYVGIYNKYGPPSEIYYFSSSPVTFILLILFYFGLSAFILISPKLLNDKFFPKSKIKKTGKKVKK